MFWILVGGAVDATGRLVGNPDARHDGIVIDGCELRGRGASSLVTGYKASCPAPFVAFPLSTVEIATNGAKSPPVAPMALGVAPMALGVAPSC